jgi:hypothetical protein
MTVHNLLLAADEQSRRLGREFQPPRPPAPTHYPGPKARPSGLRSTRLRAVRGAFHRLPAGSR